jgi:hypothetical protein
MAKQQPQQDVAKIQDEMNYLTVKNEADSLIEKFESSEDDDLQKLNTDYISFEENTKYNFIFNGMTTMKTQEGEDLQCVVLIDKENVQHINGNKVLVNNLKRVTQIPCFVRIVTGKTIKGKNGSYLDMSVYVLPETIKK